MHIPVIVHTREYLNSSLIGKHQPIPRHTIVGDELTVAVFPSYLILQLSHWHCNQLYLAGPLVSVRPTAKRQPTLLGPLNELTTSVL